MMSSAKKIDKSTITCASRPSVLLPPVIYVYDMDVSYVPTQPIDEVLAPVMP